MKLIGWSVIWIVVIASSFLYVRKVSVRMNVCKATIFAFKVACLIVIPFLLLSSWLYEPLWEQICLLLDLPEATANSYKVFVWWGLFILTLLVTTSWYIAIFRRNQGRTLNTLSTSRRGDWFPKDAPICKWTEDILHRGPFVEVLKTAIMRVDVRNCAEYIGVFGEWGTGKTSVVNLLKHDMKINESAVFVDFDPWDFRSADDAVDGFMRIIAHMAFRNGAYAVGDSFSDYLQVLRFRKTDTDYGSVGLILELVRWRFYHIFLNARRHKILLMRRLRLMPKRIVVILDDLERMPKADVSEILRTIKTNLNLPNLVFLIVSSKYHLLRAAANYLGDTEGQEEEGRECLLKIVQYQFSIPAVPQSDIMAFFKNRLRHVLKETEYLYDDYDIETDNGDEYETAVIYVKTLRSALLLANSVWEALAYLNNSSPDGALNIHVGDLIALCAIRGIDEKFYRSLPDLFKRFIRIYTNGLFLGTPEMQEHEFISWINDNTTESCRAIDMEFLKKRLGLEESQDKGGAKVYSLTGLLSSRQEMLSHYRLGSPECFWEYFYDFVSTRHAPKEMVMGFVDRIEKEENTEDIFKKARESHELPNLILSIEGLSQFSSDVKTLQYFRQLFNFARSDFNDYEYSCQRLDSLPDNIYTAIWRCLIRYCGKYRQSVGSSNTLSDIVHAGSLLFNAIKETPEPHLLWRMLSYEYGNYEKDKQVFGSYNGTPPLDLISQRSLFSWEQYEFMQVIYLDTIEKFQQDNRLCKDREFFDLLRAWNICLRAKNDEQRYKTFQALIAVSLRSISNVKNVILFLTLSEVYFKAVNVGEIKFLPIDCAGARRLFGEENLGRISETFSANNQTLNLSQRATAVALKYVIDNKFDSVVCDNEHQILFIKEWAKQNPSNSI